MAEDLACRHLERSGYVVLARRYRTRHGEIDIVAREGEVLAFVEVKARASGRFGTPFEAVTSWKRRRLLRMAAMYLARHAASEAPCRFDVVGVDLVPGAGASAITIVRNAFGRDGWV